MVCQRKVRSVGVGDQMNSDESPGQEEQPPDRPGMSRFRRQVWSDSQHEVRAAVIVAIGLILLGVVLAVVWWLLARHSNSRQVVTPDGIVINPTDSERFFAGDGWFIVLTGIVGLLAGIGAVLWRSTRGPWMFIGLAVGGLLGALLTSWLGSVFDGPAQTFNIPEIGSVKRLPIQLHSSAALVVEPFCAVAIYLLAAIANRTFGDHNPEPSPAAVGGGENGLADNP